MRVGRNVSVVAIVVSFFMLSFAAACTEILDGSASSNNDEDRQRLTEGEDYCDGTYAECNGDAGLEDAGGGGSEDAGGGSGEVDGGGTGEVDGGGTGESGGGTGEVDGGGTGESGGGTGEVDGGGTGESDGGGSGDSGGDDPRKAISFIAFCVENGDLSRSDITDIDVTASKTGGSGERLAIAWDASTPIDRVVLKTGGGELALENFDASGATSGTAAVGDGTPRLSSQTPSSPCPDGSSGVKFE